MSHTLTPTPVAITSTTLPDDGDLASASSVNTPFTDIANGAKYCPDSINGTSTGTMVPADMNVGAGLLIVDPSAGGTVGVGCPLVAAAPVTFVSTTEMVGAAVCDSTLNVVGALTCSSTISKPGVFTVSALSIICSKYIGLSGGLVQRTFDLNDADQTVSVADGDIFYMPNLTADRLYTISTAGAIDGWWVRFVAHSNTGGFKGTVVGASSVQMAAHTPIAGVTQSTTTDWRMIGGVWVLEQRVAFY